MRSIPFVLFSAAASVCGACADHPGDATGADAGASDAGPAASNVVKGSVYDENNAPIANAKICLMGRPEVPCATSAADGTYTWTLPLPADLVGDNAIVITAAGYLGVTLLDHIGNPDSFAWFDGFPISTYAAAGQLYGSGGSMGGAGFEVPGTGGFLEIVVFSGVPATVTLAESDGHPAIGGGPVYIGSNGPDPSLTATATGPATSFGGVLFGDVEGGLYDVTVTAPGRRCGVGEVGGSLPVGDWPPVVSGTTGRVAIADGTQTTDVTVVCQ